MFSIKSGIWATCAAALLVGIEARAVDLCTQLPMPEKIGELQYKVKFLERLSSTDSPTYSLLKDKENLHQRSVGADRFLSASKANYDHHVKLVAIVGGREASYIDVETRKSRAALSTGNLDQAEVFYFAFIHGLHTFNHDEALRTARAYLEKTSEGGRKGSGRYDEIAALVLRLLSKGEPSEAVERVLNDRQLDWLSLLSKLRVSQELVDSNRNEEALEMVMQSNSDMGELLGSDEICTDLPSPIVGMAARQVVSQMIELTNRDNKDGGVWLAPMDAYPHLQQRIALVTKSLDAINYPLYAAQNYLAYADYNLYLSGVMPRTGHEPGMTRFEVIAERSRELSERSLL